MTKKDMTWLVITILLVIAAVAVTWVSYPKFVPQRPSQVELYLQQQKDSLIFEIDKLEKVVDEYKKQSEKLQEEVVSLNKDYTKIKEDYDKKISSIATYTNPELDKFFSDRYG